ncbi:MAG: GAF domain-containing protein, partial [Terracidiphilus sp.]
MPLAHSQVTDYELEREDVRLASLAATGILDSKPEPAFDAITRLAARYFRADNVLLGFADQTRVWIKSCFGQPVHELPRNHSIFDMVLAKNGPVAVPDVMRSPELKRCVIPLRRLSPASFASVTVRSRDGSILGLLTVFSSQPGRFTAPEEVGMLESMADMVTAQLELCRM